MIRILKISSILLLLFYFYVKFLWIFYIDETSLQSVTVEIIDSKELPNDFYILYEKRNPNSLSQSSIKTEFENLIKQKRIACPVKQIVHELYPTGNKLLTYSLIWKIQNLGLTQKQCLNFIFRKANFMYDTRGIEEASEFYFQKNLSRLNKREIATLILMEENPRRYNVKRKLGKENLKQVLFYLLN